MAGGVALIGGKKRGDESGELLPPQAWPLAAPSERHEPQLPHLVEEPLLNRERSTRRRSEVQTPKEFRLRYDPSRNAEE
jgi:hypothetical protein